MDEAVYRALGLADDEAISIKELLGRDPNHLELAMYSVMWSEHCSYKSSRIHLARLPTEGDMVLVGPGENAGVVDVGDGIAVAIRIESHNHPSAIEPYEGAATGVGGILRDIFTMGARPIALLDPLRFGPLEDARSRWVAEGVVSGISGYGNAVGVPTVGGETVFDATYRGNPLVNVLCLGTMPTERLALGQASGVGNLAVLLGSTTGRDGIGGVSVLASAGFGDIEDDSAKRPSVQVGDPYEEKRLIEACLALLDEGLVVGIQDLGGAGLTCATSETASRGGVGMDVWVSEVHCRELDMAPFEIMTSESQERMLAIVTPAALADVLSICARWEVRASVVGAVTEGGRLRILDEPDGAVLAELPAASLHEDAPRYDRAQSEPTADDLAARLDPTDLAPPADVAGDLLAMVTGPSWVWSQYDHQLLLNTVVGPGADAAVLRLKDPRSGEDTGRGLAVTTDGNHRACAVDPRLGTALIVAEAVMNLACVGATPLALVNCLNFGNPEHPEVMWQLSESIDGLADLCRHFDLPVVGGNVSLYNESGGTDIDPTPIVGVLGLVDRLERPPPGLAWQPGERIIVLGSADATTLAGSEWAFRHGATGGTLTALDVESHRRLADFVRLLAQRGVPTSLHDISTGGLGVALAEMAVAAGVGCSVARIPDHAALFSEAPSRVVSSVAADVLPAIEAAAGDAGVTVTRIGLAGGDRFVVKGLLDLELADLQEAHQSRLSAVLGSGTTQG